MFLKMQVSPLKILAYMVLSQQRADENDFSFLTDVIVVTVLSSMDIILA